LASSIEPNTTLLYAEVARLQLKSGVEQEARQHLCAGPPEVAGPVEDSITDLIEAQIAHHRRLAARRPNHPDVHYRLGLLLRQRGHLEEAIEHFEQAVHINPVYTKALIKLGLALYEADRTDEAIRSLQGALALHPEYVDLHYRLGVIFASRQQFQLALEHFDRAVASHGENLDYRENLAIALENMGMIDRAKAMWHRIEEQAPASAHAERARAALGPH
jgi:tetratricopeptide (TPR) repeat protein